MMNYSVAEEMLVSLLKKREAKRMYTIKSNDNQLLEVDIQNGIVEYTFMDETIFKGSVNRKGSNSINTASFLMEQFIYIDRPEPEFEIYPTVN